MVCQTSILFSSLLLPHQNMRLRKFATAEVEKKKSWNKRYFLRLSLFNLPIQLLQQRNQLLLLISLSEFLLRLFAKTTHIFLASFPTLTHKILYFPLKLLREKQRFHYSLFAPSMRLVRVLAVLQNQALDQPKMKAKL